MEIIIENKTINVEVSNTEKETTIILENKVIEVAIELPVAATIVQNITNVTNITNNYYSNLTFLHTDIC